MFFSIHDLHNASTQNSKRFRRVNNITNYIFWTCVVLLIFVYIFNTKEVLDTEPTKIPTKRH